MRIHLVLAVTAVMAALAAPLHAEPPASATIPGVTNPDWPEGIASVSSFGQLVQCLSPTVTKGDVIIRSGLCTQADWAPTKSGTLSPHPRLRRNAPLVDTARLLGIGYQVGFGVKGAAGAGTQKNADGVTVFKTEDDAVRELKTRIAAGTPVQVHVDMYHMWEEVAAQEPGWQSRTKAHVSHFVAIHGYDEGKVYFADNGSRSVLGPNCDNVGVSWTAFRAAWRNAAALLKGRAKTGPYYMLYITSGPRLTVPGWTLGWLGLDAKNAPADIRAAAKALRKRSSRADVMLANAALFARMRALAVTYAAVAEESSIANAYTTSAARWQAISDNPRATTVPDTLNEIAGLEQAALVQMAANAERVAPICALYPDGTNIDSLGRVPLRWTTLPDVTGVYTEVSMKGDLYQRDTAAYVGKFRNPVVFLSERRWLKLLRRDDGNRTLSWRVRGYRNGDVVVSQVRTLSWSPQVLIASTPADNLTVDSTTSVTFTWHAPSLALMPRVVFCGDTTFTRAKRIASIPVKRGVTQAALKPGTLKLLKKRAGAGKTVYWRVEDAMSKTTTTVPSATRTLRFP